MKDVMLYCFSGSGNTRRIAERVKDVFKSEGYNCEIENMEHIKEINLNNSEYIGLLFPVAIQSTFPLVWDFIYRLPKVNRQKIFMIDTMEQFSGGIVGPVRKVLESKGYDCIAAIELKMSSSICTKNSEHEKILRKNKKALELSEDFVKNILAGKVRWPRVPILSDMMRGISSKRSIWTATSKKLSINHSRCIKCKICIRDCPVKALELKENIVVIDHSVCISCMRCVHHCPKDAFELSGKKVMRFW